MPVAYRPTTVGRRQRVRDFAGRVASPVRVLMALTFLALLSGRYSVRIWGPEHELEVRWALATLALLLFLVWLVVDHPAVIPRAMGPCFGWFTAWCFWMVLSSLWSPTETDWLGQVSDIVLLWALTALSASLFSRIELRNFWVLWVLVLAAGVVYLVGAMAGSSGHPGRLSAFGGGPNVFVRVMVLGAVAGVALATHSRRLFFLLPVPFLLIGALLSGSRGGVIAALIAGLAALLVLGGVVGVYRLLLGCAAVGGVSMLVWHLLGADQREFLYSRFVVQTIENRYLSGRSDRASHALSMYDDNPGFGQGLGSFGVTYGSAADYAHNLILSVAAEGGLVGLVLLLASLVGFVITVAKCLKEPEVVFPSLSALVVFVASMFSGDYYDTRFMWFFMVVACVAARRDRAQRGPDHGSRFQPPGSFAD